MIYHYTSQAGFEGIVREDGIHLWFSDARYMNDSSELLNAKAFFDNAAKELLSEGEIDDSLYNQIKTIKYNPRKFDGIEFAPSKNIREINFEMHSTDYHKFVCCFSEEPDSLPMWNHYLKNDGNGYAIGMDLDGIDISNCKIVGEVINSDDFELDTNISSMLYDDAEKVSIFKSEIQNFVHDIKENTNDKAHRIQCIVALQQAFEKYSTSFKDCHFAYEKEMRMMATVRKSDEIYIDGKRRDDIRFRLCHGLAIPYFELLIPNKEALCAISISPKIGLNSDEKSSVESMKFYLQHLGYNHAIDICCSTIPLRYY